MIGHQNSERLLVLKEILFNQTDEAHELDVYELKEKLIEQLNLESLDIRTIKKDLEVLEKTGFEIVKNRRKHGKIYYSHQLKYFETYQLRFLIDAILSARFITISEKNLLIDRLKTMTSEQISKTLPSIVVFSQTANYDNEHVRYNIDRIHRAIVSNQVIRYQYGNYNAKQQFVFRREGQFYEVAPYALIWQNDFYYLIGEYLLKNEIRHYRLDRIRNLEITENTFEKAKEFSLQPYINQTFHMFSGEEQIIEIKFANHLLNAIYDRFGLYVDIKAAGEDHFILKTKANLSEGLVSWILKWGQKAEVIAPESLKKRVITEIIEMKKMYEEQ